MPGPKGWWTRVPVDLLREAVNRVEGGETRGQVAQWLTGEGHRVSRTQVRDFVLNAQVRGLDDLVAEPPETGDGSGRHPKGWEPGVTYHPDRSQDLCVTGPTPPPGVDMMDYVLRVAGFDPDSWEVVGSIRTSIDPAAWHRDNQGDDAVTRSVTRFKFCAAPRSTVLLKPEDVDQVIKSVAKRKPVKPAKPAPVENIGVVGLSDWQLGKEGVRGTVARLLGVGDDILRVVREQQQVGRPLTGLRLQGLGDLTEGVACNYSNQLYTVELNQRDQQRLALQLLVGILDAAVSTGLPVEVGGVRCNHGENRSGPKSIQTEPQDNRSLSLLDSLEVVVGANPGRYERVTIDHCHGVSQVFTAGGVKVAASHGHEVRRGGWGLKPQVDWWRDRKAGDHEDGEAHLLLVAHKHHFAVVEAFSGKSVIQFPAAEEGSRYFEDATGVRSIPAQLMICVGSGYGERGWGDPHFVAENPVDGAEGLLAPLRFRELRSPEAA